MVSASAHLKSRNDRSLKIIHACSRYALQPQYVVGHLRLVYPLRKCSILHKPSSSARTCFGQKRTKFSFVRPGREVCLHRLILEEFRPLFDLLVVLESPQLCVMGSLNMFHVDFTSQKPGMLKYLAFDDIDSLPLLGPHGVKDRLPVLSPLSASFELTEIVH